MKYLTEEFYTLEILSYANSHVRKSKKAEQKDENFYRHTYEKVSRISIRKSFPPKYMNGYALKSTGINTASVALKSSISYGRK